MNISVINDPFANTVKPWEFEVTFLELKVEYLHINEVRFEHRRHSGLQVVEAGLRAVAGHFNQPSTRQRSRQTSAWV